jgi:hypothetical protein
MASVGRIVDLLQQLAQFGDVAAAQLALLAEVRDQRRHPPVEQAIQQAAALVQHPVATLEHGRIQVAPAVAFGGDGALVEQPVEQGLDGRLLPVPAVRELGDDLFGAQRMPAPEHVHHHRFGFADLHRLHL